MKKKKGNKLLSFLVIAVFLVGCAGVQQPAAKAPSAITPLNESELVIQRPILTIGSSYTFRRTYGNQGTTYMYMFLVEKRAAYLGVDAYWMKMTVVLPDGKSQEFYQLFNMDLNWLATTTADGRVLRSAKPCLKNYEWPLFRGKSWESDYEYYDGQKTYSGGDKVTVEAVETVTSPAGVFKCLKIVSRGRDAEIVRHFAPPINWNVGSTFTPNWRRPGTVTKEELVGYKIPDL